MIETLAWAAILVAVAVIAFGVSVSFGMLLGRRLDSTLEERSSVATSPGKAATMSADAGVGGRSAGRIDPSLSRDTHVGTAGQEETRGE